MTLKAIYTLYSSMKLLTKRTSEIDAIEKKLKCVRLRCVHSLGEEMISKQGKKYNLGFTKNICDVPYIWPKNSFMSYNEIKKSWVSPSS